MSFLRRKIDQYLDEWYKSKSKKPLIIKEARQIGKTKSIKEFAKRHYDHLIDINFVLNAEYRDIFDNGYAVDTIIKNISLKNPSWKFVPGKTLIFLMKSKNV